MEQTVFHWRIHRGVGLSPRLATNIRILARCLDAGKPRASRLWKYYARSLAIVSTVAATTVVLLTRINGVPRIAYAALHSTYDACDVGTLKNQTTEDGEPTAAAGLSYQPGQKLSACTCKGEDHPGPSVSTGRGGPEIDILEAQIASVDGLLRGQVSQSAQVAPYGMSSEYNADPATTH